MHTPIRPAKKGAGLTDKECGMIRNLKALLAAALAITAFSAMAASAASAATWPAAEFTAESQAGRSTTLTALPDGTAKNSHHVFDISAGETTLSITCNEFTTDAVVAGASATQITVTPH